MRVLALCISLFFVAVVHSGQVVVRKSSEPFDAFAVRDKVLKDHQWQEMLRMQQQIKILQALPTGCVAISVPYRHFRCGGYYYRPYGYPSARSGVDEVYIQVDPPLNK
ncbi:hypothetical protein K0I62_03935 [Shewanella psychrotolerans]|nr:hypothetical protein [Shewanella psychrotolerans]QYK03213.1 hypothetical protein K0I62_03935 [Shewanella psychrotolerans]